MAQGISGANFGVEYSTDNTTWTSTGATTSKVDPGSQKRMTGEAYTAGAIGATIAQGKLEPLHIEVSEVYREGASDSFRVLMGLHKAGTPVYFRFSPKGGATGDLRFTTADESNTVAPGIIEDFVYPPVDAGKGDPIMVGYTIFTSNLKDTVIS